MLGEFISPNLHVAMIHYPLGLLVVGVLVETFAFLGWRRSSFRLAGRWMIGVGAAGGVVAAFSGIYALRAIARTDVETSWADVKAASSVLRDPAVWAALRDHTLYQSIAAGLAMAAVVVWIGCSDKGRRAVHYPVLLVLLASVGGMLVGAWFGGEAIYRHGVGVETAATTRPDDAGAKPNVQPVVVKVELLFPPIELHVLLAGVATAAASVSIGLSVRRVSAAHELDDDRRPLRPGARLPGADLGYELATDPHLPRPPTAVAIARSFNPDVEVRVRPSVPAARFWLLAAVVAATASLLGWYVLARSVDFDFAHDARHLPKALWDQVRPGPGEPKVNRRIAHAVSGSLVVGVPVVLALLTRFLPRQRVLLAVWTAVLLAAVSAQVWLGVLLLYDATDGPVTRFKPSTAAVTALAR